MKRKRYLAMQHRHTDVHVISGSNCSTRHVVPADLTERLAHALMDMAFCRKFLPVRASISRDELKTVRDAFKLQALGYVRIDGSEIKLTHRAAPIVKSLKLKHWYYWFGPDTAEDIDWTLKGKTLEPTFGELSAEDFE
jgi:hypothetical protein